LDLRPVVSVSPSAAPSLRFLLLVFGCRSSVPSWAFAPRGAGTLCRVSVSISKAPLWFCRHSVLRPRDVAPGLHPENRFDLLLAELPASDFTAHDFSLVAIPAHDCQPDFFHEALSLGVQTFSFQFSLASAAWPGLHFSFLRFVLLLVNLVVIAVLISLHVISLGHWHSSPAHFSLGAGCSLH
jgi:hypothetical protein